ncbi:MAG: glycosyltransferase family 2 protein [Janthinobacterium lividum]
MANVNTISIIICTFNHASYLQKTLTSLAAVHVPETMPTELIVVDNGSTDNTAEIVRQYRSENFDVKYVSAPNRGQCEARNAGLLAAQGDVILFTDDDVCPPVDWIAGMCGPILRGEADAIAGGVKLAPHVVQPWMTLSHRGMLASTEGLDPDEPNFMVGANMAFSRRVLEKVPSFDTELGPGALGFFDESLFSWQLQAAGFRLGSALDVLVEHHPDPSRISRASMLDTQRKYGRSLGYIEHHWQHNTIKAARIRLLLRRARLLLSSLTRRGEVRRLPYPPQWEMGHALTIALLDQYLQERRKPRHYSHHGLRKLV